MQLRLSLSEYLALRGLLVTMRDQFKQQAKALEKDVSKTFYWSRSKALRQQKDLLQRAKTIQAVLDSLNDEGDFQ